MTGPGNEKASLAGLASSENNISQDSTARPAKPELDLKSWAALGGSVKPSRIARTKKRAWLRAGK
jgi:hypothetical protein